MPWQKIMFWAKSVHSTGQIIIIVYIFTKKLERLKIRSKENVFSPSISFLRHFEVYNCLNIWFLSFFYPKHSLEARLLTSRCVFVFRTRPFLQLRLSRWMTSIVSHVEQNYPREICRNDTVNEEFIFWERNLIFRHSCTYLDELIRTQKNAGHFNRKVFLSGSDRKVDRNWKI